jgi:hypothetical protein
MKFATRVPAWLSLVGCSAGMLALLAPSLATGVTVAAEAARGVRVTTARQVTVVRPNGLLQRERDAFQCSPPSANSIERAVSSAHAWELTRPRTVSASGGIGAHLDALLSLDQPHAWRGRIAVAWKANAVEYRFDLGEEGNADTICLTPHRIAAVEMATPREANDPYVATPTCSGIVVDAESARSFVIKRPPEGGIVIAPGPIFERKYVDFKASIVASGMITVYRGRKRPPTRLETLETVALAPKTDALARYLSFVLLETDDAFRMTAAGDNGNGTRADTRPTILR